MNLIIGNQYQMVILENIYIQTLLKGFNRLYFYIVCECVCVCVCKTIKVNNKKGHGIWSKWSGMGGGLVGGKKMKK